MKGTKTVLREGSLFCVCVFSIERKGVNMNEGRSLINNFTAFAPESKKKRERDLD